MRLRRLLQAELPYFATCRTLWEQFFFAPFGECTGRTQRRANARAVRRAQAWIDRTIAAIDRATLSGEKLVIPLSAWQETPTNIIGTWLAKAVIYCAVELYAAVGLSNHPHLVVRTPQSNLPDFMRYFMGNAATAINRYLHRRGGPVWGGRYAAEPILDDAALWNRQLYTLANPSEASLVDDSAKWPGLTSASFLVTGKPMKYLWFNRTAWSRAGEPEENIAPFLEVVELVHTVPPELEDFGVDELRALYRSSLAERDRANGKAAGRPAMGIAKLEKVSPNSRPRLPSFSPQPLCHASSRKAYDAFKDKMKRWYQECRDATVLWRQKVAGIEFPEGALPPPLVALPGRGAA